MMDARQLAEKWTPRRFYDPLGELQIMIVSAINDALEEAAKECEAVTATGLDDVTILASRSTATFCAARIRAMKEPVRRIAAQKD